MAIDRPNDVRLVRRWESASHPGLLPDSLVIPVDEQRAGWVVISLGRRERGSGWPGR
jgi:hypothetical protein